MRMIELPKNWSADQRTKFNAGRYRVPEDISAEQAARAVAEAGAVEVERPACKKKPVPFVAKRGRKMKGPAPSNKMMPGAEDNKTSVVPFPAKRKRGKK
jgi:hypothetical protein